MASQIPGEAIYNTGDGGAGLRGCLGCQLQLRQALHYRGHPTIIQGPLQPAKSPLTSPRQNRL